VFINPRRGEGRERNKDRNGERNREGTRKGGKRMRQGREGRRRSGSIKYSRGRLKDIVNNCIHQAGVWKI
jgi:hypothetical protein